MMPVHLTSTQSPRPHQVEAVKALLAAIGSGGRAQVVHACGAGKTRTAGLFVEQVKARTVLVMLPSLALVKQTIEDWCQQFGTQIDYRVVCSDSGVSPAEMQGMGQGLVLRDENTIASFMASASTARLKVLFSTYQSSLKMAQAAKRAKEFGWAGFDVAVCDEAHRLAGRVRRDFSLVLYDGAIPAKRRVFLTATPRLTFPGAPEDRVIGMDNEDAFGPVVHRYSFHQAMSDGILAPYKVTILGITPKELAEQGWTVDADENELRHHLGVIATLRMMHTYQLRRLVTFHSSQERSDRFATDLNALNEHEVSGAHVPRLTALSVHSGMVQRRRNLIMRMLDPAHPFPTVISNPRVLTEGIDVPTLDGVVFVDPRGSVVDTIQAVGRALRASPSKTVGHIVIPVLMVNGETAEEVTKRAGFNTAWQVLATLRDLDENFAAWVDKTALHEPTELPQGIHLDLPAGISTDAAARLARVVTLRTLNEIKTDGGYTGTIDVWCDCCHEVLLDQIAL